jgi:hypothetical protein
MVEVLDDARRLQSFLADLIDETGYACAVVEPGERPARVPTQLIVDGYLQRQLRTRDVTLLRPDRLDGLGIH